MVVLEPDPRKNWNEGLGWWTVRTECSRSLWLHGYA